MNEPGSVYADHPVLATSRETSRAHRLRDLCIDPPIARDDPPTSPQPTSLDGTCAHAHILARARLTASSVDGRRRERRRR